MEDLNKVCRICLSIIYHGNLISIDKLMNNKLQVILPELVPQLSHNSVICCGCLNSLDECYNFKRVCLSASDMIRKKTSRIKSDQKLKLDDVILWTEGTPNPLKNNLENICRTCLNPYKKKYEVEDLKVLYLLEKHFPEVDLSLSLNPSICETCTINLYKLNYFKMVYLNTNNMVNNYCQMFDIDYENINLIKLLEFNKRYKGRPSANYSQRGKHSLVEAHNKFDTTSSRTERRDRRETREGNISELDEDEDSCETNKFINDDDANVYPCSKCKKMVKDIEKHLCVHKRKKLKLVYKCNKCDYKNMFKYKFKRHLLTHKQKIEGNIYKCLQCSFQATKKGRLATHVLIHRKPDEIEMFKCDLCNFQTRQKGNLKTHLLVHNNEKKFECNFCSFRARQKGNLQTHMLKVHKNLKKKELEEALSYKCTVCSYKTMYKYLLKRHMRSHED